MGTHIIIVILDGLPREVQHSPGDDTLADEVADLKVSGEDSLCVLVLEGQESPARQSEL